MVDLNLFVPVKEASHRQKKVAEEIKFQLATILSRGDLPAVREEGGRFLSLTSSVIVTRVEISADLKHATVFITSLGGLEQDKALSYMRLQRGYLRKTLGSKIKLRCTPDLHFKIDETFETADRMMKKIADVISNDEEKMRLYGNEETKI